MCVISLQWGNFLLGRTLYIVSYVMLLPSKVMISKLGTVLLSSRTFREISLPSCMHVKSLALGWEGVGDLGLHGKHIWLLWNVTSLLHRCWHSSLLARRWCLQGAAAGRLQLHKVGKLVVHGSNRCTGCLVFFVSGYCAKTASTPLVEDCICFVCGGLRLNEYGYN